MGVMIEKDNEGGCLMDTEKLKTFYEDCVENQYF